MMEQKPNIMTRHSHHLSGSDDPLFHEKDPPPSCTYSCISTNSLETQKALQDFARLVEFYLNSEVFVGHYFRIGKVAMRHAISDRSSGPVDEFDWQATFTPCESHEADFFFRASSNTTTAQDMLSMVKTIAAISTEAVLDPSLKLRRSFRQTHGELRFHGSFDKMLLLDNRYQRIYAAFASAGPPEHLKELLLRKQGGLPIRA